MKKCKVSFFLMMIVLIVLISCGSGGKTDEKSKDSLAIQNASAENWNDLTTEESISLSGIINGEWVDEKNALHVKINLDIEPDNAVPDYRTATWIETDETDAQTKSTFCVSDKCGEKIEIQDVSHRGSLLSIYTGSSVKCYTYKIEALNSDKITTFKLTLTSKDDGKTQRILTRIQQN